MVSKIFPLMLMVTLAFSSNGQSKNEIVIDITESNEASTKSVNISQYRNGDVIVQKSTMTDIKSGKQIPKYEIAFFHYYNSVLKESNAIVGENIVFTKCAYSWQNDTLVSIRLFNPKTDQNMQLELYGFKGGSGIIIPDK